MKLYAILGSHACQAGALMLEHKGIEYERVNLPAGLHPLGIRLLGFPGAPPNDRPRGFVKAAGRLGTVPALRADGDRVQGTRAIARYVEELRPDPPLFPGDPAERRRVEGAEAWGDDVLQMVARRAVLAAARRGALVNDGNDGPLGPLLYRNPAVRRRATAVIARGFAASRAAEDRLVVKARDALDHVDALIEAGVLGGERPNAADLMIAPSVGLLWYHPDLRRDIEGRPAGRLVDRVL